MGLTASNIVARLAFLRALAHQVNEELDRLLPSESTEPARIHQAMRYSSFAGGKRIRPALVVLGGEACGGAAAHLLAPAAAMEMIHCFSLIHDDLPALDDDDLRRGQPSLHRKFDEATAVLAGDALLNLALEILASHPLAASADVRNASVLLATKAIGTFGMIGGQMADLQGPEAAGQSADARAELLESIHRRKTGALLEASLTIGGTCAQADQSTVTALGRLGQSLGLIFQIRDDVLDIEGDAQSLGKTPGKDVDAHKLTYPSLYGMEKSKQMLTAEADLARELIGRLPESVAREQLDELVLFLLDRDH